MGAGLPLFYLQLNVTLSIYLCNPAENQVIAKLCVKCPYWVTEVNDQHHMKPIIKNIYWSYMLMNMYMLVLI